MLNPNVYAKLLDRYFNLNKFTKNRIIFQASTAMNFFLHAIISKWSSYEF